jgi:hypothetical protein
VRMMVDADLAAAGLFERCEEFGKSADPSLRSV